MTECPWWRQPLHRGRGKELLSVIFGYEMVAVWTKCCPTISRLVKRHPIIGIIIIVALIHHFWVER